MLSLAERHCQVPVAVLPKLGGDYAGGYFRKAGKKVIVVNADDPVTRMRFTLGHELGHDYFNHLDRVDELKGRNAIRDTRADIARPTSWWEVQANAFAAELLIPKPAVERWEAEREPGPIGLDSVVELACRFGVSAIMACIRLHTAEVIDEERQQRLRAEIDDGDHDVLVKCHPPYADGLAEAKAAAPRLPPELKRSKLAAVARGDRDPGEVARQLGRDPGAFTALVDELDLLPLL